MPMPVRALPMVQNWDCGGCAECCQSYHIPVSEVERAKIESQGWANDPSFQGVELFVHDPQVGYRLNHHANDRCVFLGADDRCRIHAKFGSQAKPRACRIYPFVLVPAEDHWRVGMRFACPAAAANEGRPIVEKNEELREYAGLLDEETAHTRKERPSPELQAGQYVSWGDLLQFVQALLAVVSDPSDTLEHRLRRLIALAGLCRQSRFETVRGTRLREFLQLISSAIDDDVIDKPEDVPPPGWNGRSIFRQTVAVYSRRDWGLNAGIAKSSRWTRIRSAWRFARGKGRIPKLHGLIPDTTFQAAEQPAGPLSAAATAQLTRYYQVKIESLQFFGSANFGRHFWDGLDSLILTFPAILWLARVLAAEPGRSRDDAVTLALRMVDDNFGYNTLLGADRQRWAIQTLQQKGELAKLVAWYSR